MHGKYECMINKKNIMNVPRQFNNFIKQRDTNEKINKNIIITSWNTALKRQCIATLWTIHRKLLWNAASTCSISN